MRFFLLKFSSDVFMCWVSGLLSQVFFPCVHKPVYSVNQRKNLFSCVKLIRKENIHEISFNIELSEKNLFTWIFFFHVYNNMFCGKPRGKNNVHEKFCSQIYMKNIFSQILSQIF